MSDLALYLRFRSEKRGITLKMKVVWGNKKEEADFSSVAATATPRTVKRQLKALKKTSEKSRAQKQMQSS